MLDLEKFKLQYITNKTEYYGHTAGARLALSGGCRWIQLRAKPHENCMTAEEMSYLAMSTKAICRQFDATFIIDDEVELVKKIGADGVHLGKNDMPIWKARKILGDHFIIGATANTVIDIIDAVEQGANYIGLGPYKFTATKQNLSTLLGLDGYINVMTQLRNIDISIPIVAIGGIEYNDVRDLMAAGVCGVAVSGAILSSKNPEQATEQFISALKT
jgi:thiamine-phosphate pyrophosphorylase